MLTAGLNIPHPSPTLHLHRVSTMMAGELTCGAVVLAIYPVCTASGKFVLCMYLVS